MKLNSELMFASIMLALSQAACAQTMPACPDNSPVAVQVLGSGGPIADDQRSSAGYVVWVEGKSRVVIDLGGGSFLRFAQAGASFNDLDFVGLSHFHADHSTDFVALLKSGNFAGRQRALAVSGPDAGGPFPGLNEYVQALLNAERGAYRYLSGYLDGTDRLPRLDLKEVPSSGASSMLVHEDEKDDLRVWATHVPHGIVPALGFRVEVGGVSVVFASDQNGSDDGFAEFAKQVDLLVMHMPIAEGTTDSALQLHARPSRIGQIATDAGAGKLLLSHFMARSLRNLDANVTTVRNHYSGDVEIAEDLKCIVIN